VGDAQLLSGDRQAQTQAAARVRTDEGQVSAAERSMASARSVLVSARARETVYGQGSVFTSLPSPGRVVARGGQLYAIDGQPVLLLYGSVVARRAFVVGMSSGPDVAELNANLDALGYGHGLAGTSFTAATATAIRALQRAHGIGVTGMLPLGSVVFAPGAVRIKTVTPGVGVGSTVSPGLLLTVSSTRRVVTIQLDTSLEGEVRVGDSAIITLPDNTTTPGRVSFISKVATTGQNGTSVEVHAVPDDPAATGTLDQAPVNVQITTASVHHALVVPVNALVALAGGGYAVEEAVRGRHDLVAVHTGLFDDADGLVQISGDGLAAGRRVVVPGG
jgi:peptidoglycan hydrolase-like protein with peptidoglycan-binding domain